MVFDACEKKGISLELKSIRSFFEKAQGGINKRVLAFLDAKILLEKASANAQTQSLIPMSIDEEIAAKQTLASLISEGDEETVIRLLDSAVFNNNLLFLPTEQENLFRKTVQGKSKNVLVILKHFVNFTRKLVSQLIQMVNFLIGYIMIDLLV